MLPPLSLHPAIAAGGLFDVRPPPSRATRGLVTTLLVALMGAAGFGAGYSAGSPESPILVAAPFPVVASNVVSRAPDPVPAVAPAAPSASVAKRPAWSVAKGN